MSAREDAEIRKKMILEHREIILRECGDKHQVDPREIDANESWHVELTFSIGELRRFLAATRDL